MRVKKLGRYEVIGELAMGGMAEILLGRVRGPSGFERPVVIKRILRSLAGDTEFVNMFLDEARTVSRIRHPNVVSIQELGRENGELYMVMDYEEGENAGSLFKRLVTAAEELTPLVAAYIVAAASAGLHAAHESVDEAGNPVGLVHRDVSPQNLLVTYDGHVKVLDFGIAISAARKARTQAGQLKGKLAYMSPEQAGGKPLDRRSDIFSLGTILYELSTMRRLFDRDSDLATLQAIAEPIVPPSRVADNYPPELERICMRALESNRQDRYATADEMRVDLSKFMRTASDQEPRPLLEAQMRRYFADRHAEKLQMFRRLEGDASLSSETLLATTAPRNRHAMLIGSLVGAAFGVPVVALLALQMRPAQNPIGTLPEDVPLVATETASVETPVLSSTTVANANEAPHHEPIAKAVHDLATGTRPPRGKKTRATSSAASPAASATPTATSTFHRFD